MGEGGEESNEKKKTEGTQNGVLSGGGEVEGEGSV